MSNSVVEVVKDNGSKLQWAKGWFYMKEGDKTRFNPKTLKILSILSFVLITGTSGLITPQTNRYTEGPLLDEIRSDTERIKILSYFDTIKRHAKEKKVQARKAWSSQVKSIKASRLKIVSRAGLDKIPPGSEVDALLVTAATDGSVKVKLIEDLEVAGELFLPEGTILIGMGASGDERLAIGFHTAVFEDGTTQKVSGVAYEHGTKLFGLAGPRMGRRALKMTASTGLHFVAGVSQGLQDVEVRDGVAIQKPTLKNALLRGAGLAAVEQSKEMMEELKDKQTQIFVSAGTKILIVFQGAKS